jgi:hypothetical protein
MPMPSEAALPSFADLQRELPPSTPRAWRFAALHAEPRGRTALGHEIDRRLLRRRTCVAFRDIRALAEQAVRDALGATAAREPVVADLAAGPAPYLLAAVAGHPGARAVLCDTDAAALAGARAAAERTGVAARATFIRANAFDRAALGALDPRPDVVLELGLYGIEHDDARVERHFADLAEVVAPEQIVFNVQSRNPEIEYIARVWFNAAGERCVWRLRPVEQILGYAAAAGYRPASITSDRFGIYRVVRLVRAERPPAPSPVGQGASPQRGGTRWA